jgi:hypothetical protein
MSKNAYITKLFRVLAYLVLVLSVAFFPPSAAHATSKSGSVSHVSSASTGSCVTHQSPQESSAKIGHTSNYNSDAHTTHSGSGYDQCCSGICLSAVLSEELALRDTAISSRDYQLGSTQMTQVDLNGFLQPPRQLI